MKLDTNCIDTIERKRNWHACRSNSSRTLLFCRLPRHKFHIAYYQLSSIFNQSMREKKTVVDIPGLYICLFSEVALKRATFRIADISDRFFDWCRFRDCWYFLEQRSFYYYFQICFRSFFLGSAEAGRRPDVCVKKGQSAGILAQLRTAYVFSDILWTDVQVLRSKIQHFCVFLVEGRHRKCTWKLHIHCISKLIVIFLA